jgi:hypothetical protein
LVDECRHPQAEWCWGIYDMSEMKHPSRKWPKTAKDDWCGYWRPIGGPDAVQFGAVSDDDIIAWAEFDAAEVSNG